MSTSARRAMASLSPQMRAMNHTSHAAKEQPWKAFWPPKAEAFSPEEREKMPWLTWKPDGNNTTDRPWRKWMLANQSTVVRRGAW
ncbi:hypothetical protein BKA65DRAFT_161839 [Rhexocercosporidium sp. MPI-PUGE-AT-0058]|nr:hypothetical protein BKA65DRAFT_161839 [Rhexocercosporidium sp. MPI-PUGE-AT-0058]